MSVIGNSDDRAGSVVTTIPTSLVQRVSRGIRYMISGVGGPGDWFGPNQPIQPVAQEQAEGRVLDYRTGYNLVQRPREDEPVSFHQLRGLADTCNFLRLVIETRKDQMEKKTWNIQPRETTDMKPSERKAARKTDPRIARIEGFLAKPDGYNNWPTWLRKIVEEILVTDAPAIYRRRTLGGELFGLQQIDGATVKRLIDRNGLPPLPPDPAYQQILHGLPAVDYTSDQLLYLPRNQRIHKLYGFSPTEQVVMTVNIALRRALAQLSYFTEGNIPEALISCPPEWRPAQIKEMQAIFDDMLKGDTAARSGAKFVPGGLTVQFTKDALLKDDFDEWLVRIICYAFSVSPTAFTKQTNRATADSVQDASLAEGLAPLLNWVKGLIDRVIAEDFAAPDLEFQWGDDSAMAPEDAMTVNTGYVSAGIKSRNEVRSELGLDPIDNGDVVTVTAGNSVVPLEQAINPPPPPPTIVHAPGEQPPADEATDPKTGKKKDLTKRAPATIRPINRNRKAVRAARKAITATVKAFFAEQKPKAIAAVLANYKPGDASKRDPDMDIDWDALFEPMNEHLKALLQDSGDEALAQIGVSDDNVTELVNKDAVDYARNRAAAMIGKRLDDDGELIDNPDADKRIDLPTRDAIRTTVKQAEEEGWSNDKLANALGKSWAFSPSRAQAIARTETAMADVGGNMIAYRRSGVVTGKKWILGSNHDQDDECNDNADAGVIDLDDTFPTGDDAPPQHPNCICDVIPVTGSNDED